MSAGRGLAAAALAAALAVAPITSASAGKARQPPDLSGQWRLDPSRSEIPGPRGGRGEWGGRGGFPGGRGSHWGGRRGGDEDRGPADSVRSGAARGPRLPQWIRIEETSDHVTISDSTGVALLDVVTRPKAGADAKPSSAVLLLDGKWKGDRLEVERTGPRGGKFTEKYYLEDKGRTLVIETKIESSGRRPGMSFKRVYSRVNS